MSKISGRIRDVQSLTAQDKQTMYSLLSEYFDGVNERNFLHDLSEKDFAVCLEDENGRLCGFSTVLLLDFVWEGHPHKAVFSGDTIVAPDYWGSFELLKVWGQTIFRLRAQEPERKWVWFLISSGYKTYRFLPVFFHEYYPRHDRQTPPDVQAIMNQLAGSRYGRDYDAAGGIIRFSHSQERLKEGVAPVTEERLKDAHVRFFMEKNPGHLHGDELVCYCELSEANLTPAGRRMARV